MKNRIDIPAVHDNDLVQILDELGFSEMIKEGSLNCSNCNENLSLDNIGAFKAEKGQILIICDDPECIAIESLKSPL